MNLEEIMLRQKTCKQRWNLPNSESDSHEFEKFKTRIINKFKRIDYSISERSVSDFCMILGIEEKWERSMSIYARGERYSQNIINQMISAKESDIYNLFEIIFQLEFEPYEVRAVMLQKLEDIFQVSMMNANLVVEGKSVVIYPKGEKLFDEELVNKPLDFLDAKSTEHFVDALKYYQKGTDAERIKSAEKLRRTIEEFLRYKFSNEKNYKENLKLLKAKAKDQGVDPQIAAIIANVFSKIDLYFNENSKHFDGEIGEPECEFLIYQTGVLLRYIDQIDT